MYNKEYQKIWRRNNKDKVKLYNLTDNHKRKKEKSLWYIKNKESIKIKHQNWYLQNKKRILLERKLYFQKNKNKINEKIKSKLKININFKLRYYLRNRLWETLKGNYKSKSALKLLGCNIEFLKEHLQKQFLPGMSWENYGLWHIDHIRPCASFDLSKPEEQCKCFNYINLQPLWAVDNLKKGGRNGR